ncbi:MAG: DUF6116 family protein [Acidobacteriota bacterium]
MSIAKNTLASPILNFAARLRFPYLFLLTAALFLVDLFLPDFIPLADEIILGLLTLLWGSIKKKRLTVGTSPPGQTTPR